VNEQQKKCLDPFQKHPKVCGLCDSDSVIVQKFVGRKKYHGKAFLYFLVMLVSSALCSLQQKMWTEEKQQSLEATSILQKYF